jgi:hypothetical protein
MKTLICVMILFLFSCEKPHNWECAQVITKQLKGSKCTSKITFFGGFDLTYEQKRAKEQEFTYSYWKVENGDSIWVDSKCHCLPAVCPEY